MVLIVDPPIPVDERLAWREEMLELALASGAIPKRRDDWGQVILALLA